MEATHINCSSLWAFAHSALLPLFPLFCDEEIQVCDGALVKTPAPVISCALVSVSAFIHSSVFRLKLGPNLIQIVRKIICPFLSQIKCNGLFNSVPSNKLTQYHSQGLAPENVWNSTTFLNGAKVRLFSFPCFFIKVASSGIDNGIGTKKMHNRSTRSHKFGWNFAEN